MNHPGWEQRARPGLPAAHYFRPIIADAEEFPSTLENNLKKGSKDTSNKFPFFSSTAPKGGHS